MGSNFNLIGLWTHVISWSVVHEHPSSSSFDLRARLSQSLYIKSILYLFIDSSLISFASLVLRHKKIVRMPEAANLLSYFPLFPHGKTDRLDMTRQLLHRNICCILM